MSITNNNIGCI